MEVIATHIVLSSYSTSPQTHGENVSSAVDFKASIAPESLLTSRKRGVPLRDSSIGQKLGLLRGKQKVK
jgi:hypothetical protein